MAVAGSCVADSLDCDDGFLRNATHLIHDRDPLFTEAWTDLLKTGEVKGVRIPAKSPNCNPFAERFVRTFRDECLNHFVIFGERHLRVILHEYVEHDHRERNHQGLDNQLLERAPPPANPDAEIQRRERLGGLLNYYYREAA